MPYVSDPGMFEGDTPFHRLQTYGGAARAAHAPLSVQSDADLR